MTMFERMEKLKEKNNGYITTNEVIENGMTKTGLSAYVKASGMERVAHGVYMDKDAWYDPMYVLQLRNNRIIFSHETALYTYALSDREPEEINVTVPVGYNATHLRQQGVQVYTVNENIIELGCTEQKTMYGNTVKMYDMERTICDIIKKKNNIEIQVFQTALQEYVRKKDKNINRLMEYAEMLHIRKQVWMYMEVLT